MAGLWRRLIEGWGGKKDASPQPEPLPIDEEEDLPETVELSLTDVFDLHSFPPQQVADLVREYLDAAYGAGFRHVRIIHGKGKGVQREIVRKILEADPRVVSFGDPPAEAGGWGVTWVEMR
ncbi:MAG TPA: Smr/MutS family protein [Thermoanaerobaculia bacterium]|jgi:dsDNA-specific endonuclease/ATPase MutS2|nr:Smr/MutS family protein [Thermoanaerobaculia bacterium]